MPIAVSPDQKFGFRIEKLAFWVASKWPLDQFCRGFFFLKINSANWFCQNNRGSQGDNEKGMGQGCWGGRGGGGGRGGEGAAERGGSASGAGGRAAPGPAGLGPARPVSARPGRAPRQPAKPEIRIRMYLESSMLAHRAVRSLAAAMLLTSSSVSYICEMRCAAVGSSYCNACP